jgi:cholesterol transport system auxiliary component
MTRLRVLATAAALAGSLMLGGCITLLPKTAPAQLYRFGEHAGTASARPSAPGEALTGLLLSTGFTRTAESDRILTTAGSETAYIARSRWVAPASVLFDEAATRAFETGNAPFRLMRRGDIGPTNVSLRIDVETFEADYAPGWKGAPTVVVRARVLFMHPAGHGVPSSQDFEVSKPAGENRVGAIVQAYDAATEDLLSQIVTWTTAQAATVNSSG